MFDETLDSQLNREYSGGAKTVQDVLREGYSFGIADAFRIGMDLFQERLWSYLGFTVIRFSASFFLNNIPFIGFLGGLIMSPILAAGSFFVADMTYKGQNPQFENFFDGFKIKTRDLILNYLIFIGLFLIILVPFGVSFFVLGDFAYFNINNLGSIFSGGLALIAIVAFVSIFFVMCLLLFNTPLILFENLGPWEAIENSVKISMKNIGLIMTLVLALTLLNVLGAIIVLVGLLFTIPLSICVVYAAYTLIFEIKIDQVAQV